MKYICILWSYICGMWYVVWMKLHSKKPLAGINGSQSHPHLVVSLTSYGRRVEKTVALTLESVLFQSKMPDRIILWLDNMNFSIENLPKKLKKMRDKYGIEIRFCDDIRSYKKLIPTLQLCPKDILVTIDDDLVYKYNLLKELYKAHQETPNQIICALAHLPKFKGDNFIPYRMWTHNVTTPYNGVVFPLGGSGTLYPPGAFHADVINKELFTNLAPQADDIWFWAMGAMGNTKVRLINWGYPFYQIDLLYQYFHRDASLMSINLHKDFNDVQLNNVINHYPDFIRKLKALYV